MASSNFLDYVGLTRFKEKLLELVDKKLADKQPVGDYLSASVESSLVHKTGNETIAGTKTFSSTISGNVSGNAGTATKLQNAKTIALSGAVTGTATSFDGSQNITISTTSVDASKVSGTVASAATANSVAWGNVSSKPSSYTPSAHNQASNTITAMTSYAKASSSANIATTDSLNTAIGKLEYKIDANTSAIGTKANTSDLAAVATSGSYSDLSNKPTSLKNPSSLTLQNSAGTSIGSYDGSAATSVKLTASTVGLGNVTNQSKATMFTSPAFTGTPTAPTATAGTNTTQIATTAFVTNALANKADTNTTYSLSKSGSTITLTGSDGSTTSVTDSDTNTVYTHPSYTAKSSGFYKVTVDATGHVSATTAVTKADITGLGIPAQDTVYTLPNATSSVLGGVKVGSNITVSSGTISLTKANVTSALGYTPPTTNTTYSAATTSAAGLMSAADKAKLDGIATGANNYTYTLPNATSSTLGGVKVGSNITVSSGTISLTSSNVTSALGYTPLKVTASGEGYRALSDGRIKQWGKAKIANGDGTKIAFPIAFPNAVESFVCTPIGKAVSCGVELDSSLGGATITHNGNGGVEVYYRVIGS